MSVTLPTPRRIAGALAVLRALPAPALAALAESLIDRMDALDADSDLEPDDEGELTPDDEGDLDGPPVAGPVGCGSFPACRNTGGWSPGRH